MMQILTFSGQVIGDAAHHELLAAYPGLNNKVSLPEERGPDGELIQEAVEVDGLFVETTQDETGTPVVRVHYNEAEVTEEQVAAILHAHDFTTAEAAEAAKASAQTAVMPSAVASAASAAVGAVIPYLAPAAPQAARDQATAAAHSAAEQALTS